MLRWFYMGGGARSRRQRKGGDSVPQMLKHFAGLKKLLSSISPTGDHRVRGVVKWFSNQKGYGFIEREDEGEDVFVHHSEVKKAGFKTLHAGQHVAFDVVSEKRGSKAVNLSQASKG